MAGPKAVMSLDLKSARKTNQLEMGPSNLMMSEPVGRVPRRVNPAERSSFRNRADLRHLGICAAVAMLLAHWALLSYLKSLDVLVVALCLP